LFKNLCSFGWFVPGLGVVPLVYDVLNLDKIYGDAGVYFMSLKHVDEFGLLSFRDFTGFETTKLPQKITLFYYGLPVEITFPKPQENSLSLGHILLSKTGQELAPVCGSARRPGFRDYVIAKWKAMGLQVADLTENHDAAPNRQSGEASTTPGGQTGD